MKNQKIAVVGTGLAPKFIVLDLLKKGCNVTFFDCDKTCSINDKNTNLSFGKIDVFSQMEHLPPLIFKLGYLSHDKWKENLDFLGGGFYYQDNGSLVVTSQKSHGEFTQLVKRINDFNLPKSKAEIIESKDLKTIEEGLNGSFERGVYFRDGLQVNDEELMSVLNITLKNMGVNWKSGITVEEIKQKNVYYRPVIGGSQYWREEFDWVLEFHNYLNDSDTVKKSQIELIELYAPGVKLKRSLRYTRFNFPMFILPTSKDKYLIEAYFEDKSPVDNVSVRSFLELLSSACQIDPCFSQAIVTKTDVKFTPNLSESIPKASFANNHFILEGIGRYGFLIIPQLSAMISLMIEKDEISDDFSQFFL